MPCLGQAHGEIKSKVEHISKPISPKELGTLLSMIARPAAVEPAGSQVANVTFDRTATLQRVDGDVDLLKDIAEAFIAEGPKWISQMRTAFDSENWPLLRRVAHTYKGAVSTFSISDIADLAGALELAAAEGDSSKAQPLLKLLESYSGQVCGLLRAVCAEQSCVS
jgi:HPt (histidine-containing phosphotransfer) domain-containing protein